MSILAILGRLLLATVCSRLIGYERETARKAAGLRTFPLGRCGRRCVLGRLDHRV